MSTESLYRKAEHADEIADPDLTEANVAAIYNVWRDFLGERYAPHEAFHRSNNDSLYEQACRLVRPFKKQLTGTITEKDLGPMTNDRYIWSVKDMFCSAGEEHCLAGLFLSALLNETNVDKLSLGSFPCVLSDAGYRLQPGKTVEIREGGWVDDCCSYAQGGIGIVRGKVEKHLGRYASGGIFPVYGTVEGGVGWDASGGVFPIYGVVEQAVGDQASGGIFPIHGTVEGRIGRESSGGTFVVCKKPKKRFLYKSNGACGAGPDELEKDAELSRLMDELEQAGKTEKFDEVEKIARRVDEHVRKNYKRKVA